VRALLVLTTAALLLPGVYAWWAPAKALGLKAASVGAFFIPSINAKEVQSGEMGSRTRGNIDRRASDIALAGNHR
jgi:hypothetical protein